MNRRARQNGFTLLEVVVVTLLVGLAAVSVTAFFTKAVEGALFTRDVTAAQENIQAALTRVTHEVANLDTKRAYSFANNAIVYYYRDESTQTTIARSGTLLQINGETLLDNVVNSTAGFTVTQPINAYSITVSLSVNIPVLNASSVTKTYSTVINLNTQRFQ